MTLHETLATIPYRDNLLRDDVSPESPWLCDGTMALLREALVSEPPAVERIRNIEPERVELAVRKLAEQRPSHPVDDVEVFHVDDVEVPHGGELEPTLVVETHDTRFDGHLVRFALEHLGPCLVRMAPDSKVLSFHRDGRLIGVLMGLREKTP